MRSDQNAEPAATKGFEQALDVFFELVAHDCVVLRIDGKREQALIFCVVIV
jgi:hypothetical protein